MSVISIQVRMPWDTTDVRGPLSSNTFHVQAPGAGIDPAAMFTIANDINAFYATVGQYFSSIMTGRTEIHAYDLDDPKPRLPIFELPTDAVFTPDTDTLPGEVSINVGYRAAPTVGVPRQRFRGTMHLGPLAKAAVDDTGHVPDAVLDDVETALTALAAGVNFTACQLVVGSEAQGFVPIERFTVVNELGTVRRRQFPRSDRRTITV